MNKKKMLLFSAIAIIFLLNGLLIINKKQELKQAGKVVNKGLLNIDYLVDMDSLPIHNNLRPDFKATLLILFNSECEACQVEVKTIIKRIAQLENVSIFFISSEDIIKIKLFSKEHNLENLGNITIAKANESDLFNIFKSYSYPSVFLYDKERRFVSSYKGSSNIDAIIGDLQEIKN